MANNTYITSKEKFLSQSIDSFIDGLKEKGMGIDDAIAALQQRKNNLKRNAITIPVCIFANDKISALEAITKYLKEEEKISYHEIAVLLARNDRTIWHAYHQACMKMPEPLPKGKKKDAITLPPHIFRERKISVLEHIAAYLKEKHGLSFHQIAELIHRDDRTIWTVFHRAQKKGVTYD